MDPESYCREIEAYLCRKNDGHLIRISGPAFDRVISWARDGVPLKVACEGIDRYFERYYRRGPRRRPVRIEFCEADVLDAFDVWRRAVGMAQSEPSTGRKPPSLASHLERVIARLTTLRASSQRAQAIDPVLRRVTAELDALLGEARGARGAGRDLLLQRLVQLDRELLDAAAATLDEPARQAAATEAREQLAPFRERMTPAAFQQACGAAMERAVREQFGLPALTFA